MKVIEKWTTKTLISHNYETNYLYEDRMITVQKYEQMKKAMCEDCSVTCHEHSPWWDRCKQASNILKADFSLSKVKIISAVSLMAVSYVLNYGGSKSKAE